jgi:dual specificity phosphatase 12
MPTVKRHCRIAVIGAQRQRVAKVVSLLLHHHQPDRDGAAPFEQLLRQHAHDGSEYHVTIEYLPCVASFGDYKNEEGKTIRYLASVEYHGPHGQQRKGSSLAPFFDATDEDDDKDGLASFQGISAIALGCGIESNEDVDMIKSFVKTLCSKSSPPVISCVQSNKEYTTMQEETAAYRALSPDEKEEATKLQIIGPGKMAKFAAELASRVIHDVLAGSDRLQDGPAEDVNQQPQAAIEPITEEPDLQPQRQANLSKPQYACRMCRAVLFGEADLENPPHVPSRHQFSARKLHHGGESTSSRSCRSLFLAKGLDWMGDLSGAEGKFSCPKCYCKLGSWHWAGAQCSCGTWVTPAVQVPLGKVDIVQPAQEGPPPGAVISPFAK